ncbi:hypothetical protein HYV69_00770 [Candidatus Uhrbacteria bacterium]|nr:hypothetical protein [Candidatus Uhrbacteria bacterium]
MMNIKKAFIFVFLLAIAVSPVVPFAKATDGQWKTNISDAIWNYDLYRVERLAFNKTVSGPYEFNQGVFVTEQDSISFLKDDSTLRIPNVNKQITSSFWHSAQDDRFVYLVPSTDGKSWATVYEYFADSGVIKTLDTIVRKSDDLNYLTSAVDGSRVYSSILHTDAITKNIENKLVVSDYQTGYKFDDFTWALNAPIQEIVDVKDSLVLAKFQFDGGFKQLLMIDEKSRTVTPVPATWTQPDGDIVGAHFLSDGTIQYFQNYRLYTFKPGVDSVSHESGGAYLNWFVDAEDAIQFVGDRMAYIDSENTLYVTNLQGASSFGKALNGKFNLEKDAIYYESLDGYIGYTFSTKTWEVQSFLVTDTYEDTMVGTDGSGNIWYKNLKTGKIVNVGFGSNPVLAGREDAYWKGTDGKIYHAEFSPLLDVGDADVQAVKAFGKPTVYIISGNKMWKVADEVTYFTWFDSWKDVVSVSQQTLKVYTDSHTDMGNALFAPGTRVKAVSDPRVYVVGSGGSLHWIVSETVADSIYGPSWNKGIIEVSSVKLWDYSNGTQINSNKDIKTI